MVKNWFLAMGQQNIETRKVGMVFFRLTTFYDTILCFNQNIWLGVPLYNSNGMVLGWRWSKIEGIFGLENLSNLLLVGTHQPGVG